MALSTVINRTRRNLIAVFDGEEYFIPPGESQLPEKVVPYAMRQNPLMGSLNPFDPTKMEFLIGRKGRDDCSPIENDPNEVELVKRSMIPIPAGKKYQRIKAQPTTSWEARDTGTGTIADGEAASAGD